MNCRLLPLLMLPAVVACAAEIGPADNGTASVRDSAGITIVDLGVVDYDALPVWRLADPPILDIGQAEGDAPYLLFRVTDAIRRSDGSVVLLNNFTQVRAFDAEGNHLWSQGGEGGGPGAYTGTVAVDRIRGDSLVVFDGRLRRFTILSGEGEFARVITPEFRPVDFLGAPAPDRLLTTTSVSNGIVRSYSGTQPPPATAPSVEIEAEDGWTRLPSWVEFSVLDPEGRTALFLGRHEHLAYYRKGQGLPDRPPWDALSVFDVVDDGMWYGRGLDYELHLLRDDSGPTRILRWQGPGRTPSPELIEAHFEWLEEAENDTEPPMRVITDALRRIPDDLPAYSRLSTDRVGRLWLRDYYPDPPAEYHWTVFSADGTHVLGRITLPRETWMFDIGEDWMLVRETDAMDVEHVRLYEIRKP